MLFVIHLQLEHLCALYRYGAVLDTLLVFGSYTYECVTVIAGKLELHTNGGRDRKRAVSNSLEAEVLGLVVFVIRNVVSGFILVLPLDLGINSLEFIELRSEYVTVNVSYVEFIYSALCKLKLGSIFSAEEYAVSLDVEFLYLRYLSVACKFDLYVFAFLNFALKGAGINVKRHNVAVSGSVGNDHIVISVRNSNRGLLQLCQRIYTVKLKSAYLINSYVGILVVFSGINAYNFETLSSEVLFGMLI